MEKRFREIILRYGELKEISEEINITTNTIHGALCGRFASHSRNYVSAMAIRRYVLDKFPTRYRNIKE